jgi:hypothetical protein
MSEVGWRPLRRMGAKVGAEIRKVDRQINLQGGGSVTVRSADTPDSLRGEGLDFVVLDECAFIAEAAWLEALRPSLSDRQGRAMFISTPKGHNWFWRIWQQGKDEDDPEWHSWEFPTSDNPFIEPGEIEAAKAGLPERIYQQEYMAAFIDDAGGVFRRVMDAATATLQDSRQYRIVDGEERGWHQYIIGVDWGKHNDFTVITVMDVDTSELVLMDRFNQIDYAVQVGRLKAIVARFKPPSIVAEQNSMGEPLVEQLQREGLHVIPFTTTNATKAVAVEALALAFERGDIRILNDPVLIGELQAFEMSRTPSGMVRYAAPEGLHDDCVISLALAWQGAAVKPQAIPEQVTTPSKWAVGSTTSRNGSRFKGRF